jgi:hypothetical protein
MPATARCSASSSSVRSGGVPHTRHQVRTSSLDAGLAPCSILLTFDTPCHPAFDDRAWPVRPAASRISRSWSARACRACWALEEDEDGTVGLDPVLLMRYRELPHGLECRPARFDHPGVIAVLATLGLAIPAKEGEADQAVIEYPVRVTG